MLLLFHGTTVNLTSFEMTPNGLYGFTSATPHVRQSAPLPPSTLKDPAQYIRELDSQIKSNRDTPSHTLPYVRSLAASTIAVMDNAFLSLSSLAQTPGLWRSIADGVSSQTSPLIVCHSNNPNTNAKQSKTTTLLPIYCTFLARTSNIGFPYW
jgi:hypothetical protein